ncbi:probable aquaporin TIP5-1 isoform X2 [Phragmites australis]|uniref:probable aquaporin TIP5-1 isoform X2 n=1 Tax=Phragmites australis TaxID=29695 RepID=UPI002D7682F3|nr:probable aquaporin TIP5-1 isoform X2 [Phragmites australis]
MASNLRLHLQHCFSPPSLRSYFAEFISTFLFVFTAVGSAISARMLTPDVTSDASSLVATAVAQAFGLFAAVFIAGDVSGGHVNPAVTFAFAVGGHIGVPSAIFYWASQLLGSTLACLVLHFISAGQAVPTTRIAAEMTGFGAAILEGVLTFLLVYTVHVAGDPRVGGKKGFATTALGSLLVGLLTGACVLAAGSLTGASMNPARSFGPAVVGGDFKNQAVYWVGPMIGAAVAALVHQSLVFPSVPEPRHGNVGTAAVV